MPKADRFDRMENRAPIPPAHLHRYGETKIEMRGYGHVEVRYCPCGAFIVHPLPATHTP